MSGHIGLNHRPRYRAVLDGDKSAVNTGDDRKELVKQMRSWGYVMSRGDYVIEEDDVERSGRCVWCQSLAKRGIA